MAAATRKLLDDILALSAEERLELAAEILASVEGPVDEDWDAAWLDECERRSRAAAERQEPASTWAEARDRILARLQTS
jgi:putative addiction module component (TIGR02574 family)